MYKILGWCLILTLVSCKTPSFTTANDMRLINGTIQLKNGDEIKGAISSDIERNYNLNYITITKTDSKKPERISINDIQSMSVRGNIYEPKLIDMSFRDQVRFVKRLTRENSRIQLYELYEQSTNISNNSNGATDTRVRDKYSYYIITPSHAPQQTAWNIEGKHLTPNFEDKMSEIVKNCPTLADKIRRKEKGYFYAQISLIQEKKLQIVLSIIDEYNNCTAKN